MARCSYVITSDIVGSPLQNASINMHSTRGGQLRHLELLSHSASINMHSTRVRQLRHLELLSHSASINMHSIREGGRNFLLRSYCIKPYNALCFALHYHSICVYNMKFIMFLPILSWMNVDRCTV